MSAKAKPLSPVVAFLGMVYDHSNEAKNHSWAILNGALQGALRIAIKSHFRFQPDDFHELYKRFNGGYWFGTDPDGKGMGTWRYSLAVECNNMSACQSYEAWKGIRPYLFLGKRLCYGAELALNPDIDKVEPGSLQRFKTDDQLLEHLTAEKKNRWWVTGFDADSMRLARYHSDKNPHGRQQGKPTKLRKITHAELDEMSKILRAGMRPVKEKKEVSRG